ncbi:MAG: HEAT repeat domain-containing protein, partial [Myxococcales bacterium]|nr:HEAT repeat domain-containing protein [Myxococcales bacterium]
ASTDAPQLRTAPAPSGVAGCGGSLRGVAKESPWAINPKGGMWEGTGHPDPDPLKSISDEEMIARANNGADTGADRKHALVSVGRRHANGAMEALEKAIAPNEPQAVREMGLSGMMEHGGPRALDLMWQMLRTEASAQLRGQAIWGIALYGPSQALRAIEVGLQDTDVGVQGMAVLAVWAINDDLGTSLPILEAAAGKAERRVWQEALNVLGRMPYPEAAQLLLEIAETSDGDKRQSAAMYYRNWMSQFPDMATHCLK